MRRSWRYLLPVAVFLAISVFLLLGLGRDPREIPSPLIGKPAPSFSLPTLASPAERLAAGDLSGQVWLLNVWASWCAPCLVEHPLLLQLARDKVVPIVGINYKDDPAAARAWLAKHGDPFARIAVDRDGKTAIDYGVYGVPETFLIDRNGVIRYKHIGPLTPEAVSGKLVPLIRELQR